MKYVILPLILIINIGLSNAQNLVRNSSFEDDKSCVLNREDAVQDAAPWYVAGGTPDAYQFNCNNPNLFENTIRRPYDGEVFLSIGGGGFPGNNYFTEGMGIELTESLEAGEEYLLEAKVRSFRFNGNTSQCPTFPRQKFLIYLSQDSFQVTNNYQGLDLVESSTNGRIVYADSSEQIIPPLRDNNPNFFAENTEVPWQTIRFCIEAQGGERFLGITLQTGAFISEPTCINTSDFFPVHYVNLDVIKLTKYPEEFEVTVPICIDEPNEVRLRELLPDEFAEVAIFRWSDRDGTDTRNVYRQGTEVIEVIFPCGQIATLTLNLEGTDCKTYLYVPTGFSPNNFDGINDDIKPFIKNYWEITNYEYQVYNRWGQLLFKTNDYNLGWNGQVNGEMMNEGVYVWMVKYEQHEDGETKSYVKSGEFTLVK